MSSFSELLEEYGRLSAWAAASGAVPFLGALGSLAPPSHPVTIAGITSVVQLVVLVLTYQLLNPPRKRIVSLVMVYSFEFLIIATLTYGILFRLLTVTLLNSSERIIRGFICTEIALHEFRDKCPLLSGTELNEIRNRPEVLWTEPSIVVSHVVLFALWVAIFVALAAFIGSFVAYQQRRKKLR